jgi:hypothetical protein
MVAGAQPWRPELPGWRALSAGGNMRLIAVGALLIACGEAAEPESAPLVSGEPVVIVHAEQPMIADLIVTLSATASASIQVPADPGVRAERAEAAAPGELRLRLRGLAPGVEHRLELELAGSGGRTEHWSLAFATPPPLSGFVQNFAVTGTGSEEYRFFDYSVTPDVSSSGLFAVDAAGTTRFYLSSPSSSDGDVHLRPPAGVKLLRDGRLLYVQDGRLLIVDEMGKRQLDLAASWVGVSAFHHDALELPNGNLLVLGHEFGDFPDPATGAITHVAGDVIVELTPGGEKVWHWSSFAHLDTGRVPGPDYYMISIEDPATGKLGRDWTHGNGIIHTPSDDSILLSLRHQDWILKIDRASGQVIWRLGKDGDFALDSGSWFFHQHSPEWQPDGSLLLYDNGIGNPDLPLAEQRSRPVRYVLDEGLLTAFEAWQESEEAYMSAIAGDADRLHDGAVLVLDSALPIDPTQPFDFQIYSRLREVDPVTNQWRWTLLSEQNRFIYRCLAADRLPGVAK